MSDPLHERNFKGERWKEHTTTFLTYSKSYRPVLNKLIPPHHRLRSVVSLGAKEKCRVHLSRWDEKSSRCLPRCAAARKRLLSYIEKVMKLTHTPSGGVNVGLTAAKRLFTELLGILPIYTFSVEKGGLFCAESIVCITRRQGFGFTIRTTEERTWGYYSFAQQKPPPSSIRIQPVTTDVKFGRHRESLIKSSNIMAERPFNSLLKMTGLTWRVDDCRFNRGLDQWFWRWTTAGTSKCFNHFHYWNETMDLEWWWWCARCCLSEYREPFPCRRESSKAGIQ